jgi:sulfoxide reductase heme-binding subunit YedZ
MLALAGLAASGGLGADPIAAALNRLGLLTLVLLVASLGATPLKTFIGWTWPLRLRRALGLLAFACACAHVGVYALVDQGAALMAIWADVVKRPFITVGFAAFVLLVPLALTSTDAAVRRLGFPKWKRLHRLAYLATALGALHFFWRVKKDVTEPLIYALIIAGLLGLRLISKRGKQLTSPAR